MSKDEKYSKLAVVCLLRGILALILMVQDTGLVLLTPCKSYGETMCMMTSYGVIGWEILGDIL